MINDKPDEVIVEFFQSRFYRNQIGLETSMKKGSSTIFDQVYLLYCKCHKASLTCGGLYIDSPNWIKNKKATINPVNALNMLQNFY